MSDIDKIVAEMPKIKCVYPGLATAQCRLLAEAGYRKVRSVEEILEKLISITGWSSTLNVVCLREDAEEIYRWQMEGDKEKRKRKDYHDFDRGTGSDGRNAYR